MGQKKHSKMGEYREKKMTANIVAFVLYFLVFIISSIEYNVSHE